MSYRKLFGHPLETFLVHIEDRYKDNQKLQEEKEWSSETEDHEKQCLAALKRLKGIVVAKTGEVATNTHLRLAVETEEETETRARLENDAATKTAQFGHVEG